MNPLLSSRGRALELSPSSSVSSVILRRHLSSALQLMNPPRILFSPNALLPSLACTYKNCNKQNTSKGCIFSQARGGPRLSARVRAGLSAYDDNNFEKTYVEKMHQLYSKNVGIRKRVYVRKRSPSETLQKVHKCPKKVHAAEFRKAIGANLCPPWFGARNICCL